MLEGYVQFLKRQRDHFDSEHYPDDSPYARGSSEAYACALTYIRSIWRKVEAEKPDADQIVLIHCPDSCEPVWLGYWDDENGRWYGEDGMPLKVTHWMELPEPPTKGDKA